MIRHPSPLLPLKRKDHGGMLPEQFYLLEKGDIIKNRGSGALRKIEWVGKGNGGKTYWVHMLKLQRSRFPSPHTTYCPADASKFLPVKVKNPEIWEWTYERAMKNRVRAYKFRKRKQMNAMKRRIREMQKIIYAR